MPDGDWLRGGEGAWPAPRGHQRTNRSLGIAQRRNQRHDLVLIGETVRLIWVRSDAANRRRWRKVSSAWRYEGESLRQRGRAATRGDNDVCRTSGGLRADNGNQDG